jgi:hypothetical protein
MAEPPVKWAHARIGTVNKYNKGAIEMAKITAVIAVMCALSAFATYPSADERRQSAMETISPLAMSQVVRSLPTEAYDAI